eukprot:TRINITY_DN32525_c0_g1_i1.p1 TRINITY_DN32525_c0_g1~~TRINITY_DN32525_c0_g1_i1.p1  ORF type:complete len:637 (+),score=97.61 TRINITY_DN32525_c0_g1_i1:32-1912(+)
MARVCAEQERWTVPQPWREQPQGAAGGLQAPSAAERWSLRRNTCFDGDVQGPSDTLYESSEGAFVTSRSSAGRFAGSQVTATRRCFVFLPEPGALPAAIPDGFQTSRQVSHTAVRSGSGADSRQGGALALLRRWGQAGALLERLVEQGGQLSAWALQQWLLSFLLFIVSWLRMKFAQLVWRDARPQEASEAATSPEATLVWHPDCDLLASISTSGRVAVHSLGDAIGGASSEHLVAPGTHHSVSCVAWQPCDLRGTLAVGGASGLALWRRGAPGLGRISGAASGSVAGWHRAWSLQGEAFFCPALAWAPDGRALAVGGPGGVVRVLGPHSDLLAEEELPGYCASLWRWSGGPVASLAWSHDCTVLAALHQSRPGAEPLVRLWDTRSWEVAAHVSLGLQPSAGLGNGGLSLAWLGNDVLLATGAGRLVEVCLGAGHGCAVSVGGLGARVGEGGGLKAWLAGVDPAVRELPLPQPGGPQEVTWAVPLPGEAPSRPVVLEVAVCPRAAQRVAVRLEGCREVLVFDKPGCGLAGWSQTELMPCGPISAVCGSEEDVRPLALSFAAGRLGKQIGLRGSSGRIDEGCFEGSLLAVYWGFKSAAGERAEVRTYPMHYLPTAVLQSGAATSSLF